jgi:formylglycine-generating enzyme required for sulfatase activity
MGQMRRRTSIAIVTVALAAAGGCTSLLGIDEPRVVGDDAGSSSGSDVDGTEGDFGSASSSGAGMGDGGSDGGSSGDAGNGAARVPPSCAPGGPGMTDCGPSRESCCTTLPVDGGTFDRTYLNDGGVPTGNADPASIGSFFFDKYPVTVGRFRQFMKAWDGGAGWSLTTGSGKHTHLNGGRGLANSAGPGFEEGWSAADNTNVAPIGADGGINLDCDPNFATWTPDSGAEERLPINCVNWYEAYAFCIWDGGFLPSEAEWEYAAAGGSEEREYPWGSKDPGTANDQYAVYCCDYPNGSCCDSSACCTAGTGNLAPVGTAQLGAARWGQLDLGGNVRGWVLDWEAPYGNPCVDCAELTLPDGAPPYRVHRGSYYYDYAESDLHPTARDAYFPWKRYGGIGFRCARSP